MPSKSKGKSASQVSKKATEQEVRKAATEVLEVDEDLPAELEVAESQLNALQQAFDTQQQQQRLQAQVNKQGEDLAALTTLVSDVVAKQAESNTTLKGIEALLLQLQPSQQQQQQQQPPAATPAAAPTAAGPPAAAPSAAETGELPDAMDVDTSNGATAAGAAAAAANTVTGDSPGSDELPLETHEPTELLRLITFWREQLPGQPQEVTYLTVAALESSPSQFVGDVLRTCSRELGADRSLLAALSGRLADFGSSLTATQLDDLPAALELHGDLRNAVVRTPRSEPNFEVARELAHEFVLEVHTLLRGPPLTRAVLKAFRAINRATGNPSAAVVAVPPVTAAPPATAAPQPGAVTAAPAPAAHTNTAAPATGADVQAQLLADQMRIARLQFVNKAGILAAERVKDNPLARYMTQEEFVKLLMDTVADELAAEGHNRHLSGDERAELRRIVQRIKDVGSKLPERAGPAEAAALGYQPPKGNMQRGKAPGVNGKTFKPKAKDGKGRPQGGRSQGGRGSGGRGQGGRGQGGAAAAANAQ